MIDFSTSHIAMTATDNLNRTAQLPKALTGIRGLDEITCGGLPRGRTTLVCGSPGCGKTLLGMEFLVRGAMQHGEPGVCLSFEENVGELTANVASLGFDVQNLTARKLLAIDHVYLERSLIEETGDYDLEALFVRLAFAVDSVGARRVFIDSVESLFAGLTNDSVLRSELRRLFRWMKDRQLTAVVTGEGGGEVLTRHGLQEYITDCVIALDHRVVDSVSTRRLRVVKYRGSTHGSNEYPFIIDRDGISVLPVTSLGLQHPVSSERVSTGVLALDEMFGGQGYFRGSSILISGTAGTGKTSLAAHFVNAACARGERCAYFSFEESTDQLIRNMASIGLDLRRWVDQGLLQFDTARPTTFGLELHLVKMHRMVEQFRPSVVIVDPVTAFLHAGTPLETRGMLLRLIDFLKAAGITAVLAALTRSSEIQEETIVNISSLVDCWLLLRDIETGGERNRGLYLLKARGLAHSNQIREFLLSGEGIQLREVYLGEAGLLTGSARVTREAQDASAALMERQEFDRRLAVIERKRKVIESQIAMLQLELGSEDDALRQLATEQQVRADKLSQDAGAMARSRSVLSTAAAGTTRVAR